MTKKILNESSIKNNLKIFFILADARSGNTFLANNLMKKLGILIIPETNFIIRLLKVKKSILNSEISLINFLFEEKKFHDLKIKKKELLHNLKNINSIKEIILTILEIYYKKNNGRKLYIGIKKGYLYSIDKIMNLFPNSKIINIIRDSRAVYNSKKNSIYSLSGKPFDLNPYNSAKVWNEKADIIFKTKKKYSALILYYEDIIKDLNLKVNQISKFLDLEIPKQNFLNKSKGYYVSKIYHEQLHSNIDLPPKVENIDKWKRKLLSHEVFCIEFLNKKKLEEFNYKLVNEKKNFKNYLFLCIFCIKYLLSNFSKF
jgi:hypothetical protein